MVAVSGSTLAVGALIFAVIGGGGTYAVLKYFNGGEDFPPIDHSNFGFAKWRKKSSSNLLSINMDFNGDDAIFVVGVVVVVCFCIKLC